ncbi:MAG: hypothetical protein K8S62_02195 [Candidatus Sabulitectum sp.]|nr:hypothetical protein [Candidatus Sabulitectum sp.]
MWLSLSVMTTGRKVLYNPANAMKGGTMHPGSHLKKTIIKFLPITLLLFVSVALADSIEPPDIHTQTLAEYINASDPIVEIRLRQSCYIDSLRSELTSLAAELEDHLVNTEAQLQLFRESHEAFLLSTDLWASFTEEIQWYNLATGEPDFGSGLDGTYIIITASMLWEKILDYRQLLQSIEEYGVTGIPNCRNSSTIGGE